eukprot:TRINITY_DN7518_c0_g1_i1.p1 TRINITY_DN7518_c0_g1~~TRINITY_DN7518_c0_g1_i1.p1  ORF type:complete len:482 (+),score=88.27 TRINITY_DN7518_c0_g1_i1:76-1521(+)
MTENEAKSMPMLETSVKKQYPDLPANHMTFESHRSSSFSRVQALAGPSYGTLPRSKSIPGRRDPGLDAFHQIRAYSPVRGGKIRGSTASKVQSVRSLHCIDIFGENFHRLLNINDPYSLRTDLDTLIRKKNLATLLVAIVGIFLMIAENVINWDSENKEIISDNYTQALKVFTTLSTILLVFMIAENYRVLSFVVAGNCHLSTLNRFSLVLENHGLRFVLEIFVCLLHIPPYIDHFMQENPDKYGIFMFLRLYLGVKVLRDYSPVYVQRAKILQRMERSRTGTAFDGYLVHIRRIFFHYPGRFVLSMLAIIYPIMVFSIYLQEREAQDEFTFDASLWFTAVTMMTVGYGDLVAKSLVGRVCAVIAGVLGILLSSLCVAVMSGFLNLSRRQRFAVDWVSKAYLDECVENEAARVIQVSSLIIILLSLTLVIRSMMLTISARKCPSEKNTLGIDEIKNNQDYCIVSKTKLWTIFLSRSARSKR